LYLYYSILICHQA